MSYNVEKIKMYNIYFIFTLITANKYASFINRIPLINSEINLILRFINFLKKKF